MHENQLYSKDEKCLFNVPNVSFLGHITSQEHIKTDDTKVKAVTEWPVPSMVKDLQHFLGFANFYPCFIQGFSAIAAPLTSHKSPQNTHLEQHCQEAFH